LWPVLLSSRKFEKGPVLVLRPGVDRQRPQKTETGGGTPSQAVLGLPRGLYGEVLMERFRVLVRKLSYGACFIGMLFALPLMLLTVADVAGRIFFDKPIPGSFELSEYMLSVLILMGAAYTQHVKGHVGVDFLTKRFSSKLQDLCGVITTLACLFIVSILVWQGYLDAMAETAVSDQLRIPQRPFKMLVALGGALLFMEFAVDLWEKLERLMGRRP